MTFFGTSLLVDEEGTILQKGSRDREEILLADFDVNQIRRKRRTWGIYRDRRTDLYGEILTSGKEEK